MRILALLGSLAASSSNKTLLNNARGLAPDGVEIVIYDRVGDLPHFNPDLDRPGCKLPPAVLELRAALAASQALLISTPEYAHGIPGALKNALDWLVSGPEMVGMPVGLILGSATDGSFARAALIETLKTMSAQVVPDAVCSISGVRGKIDSQGALSDPQSIVDLKAAILALARARTDNCRVDVL